MSSFMPTEVEAALKHEHDCIRRGVRPEFNDDEIEIIVDEDGNVWCPNPSWWHLYFLGMVDLETALEHDGEEYVCG